MRILQRIIALFITVMLLMPTYVAFAVDTPPDFIDGGDTVMEQSNEQSGDGVIREDETPPETDDAEQEQDNEDTGDKYAAPNQADDNTGDDNIVTDDNNTAELIESEAKFWEWVENNPTGGEVSLGANIELTRTGWLDNLIIDTGAYGITFKNGSIGGTVTITGEGVDNPVLTVVNMGLRFGTWNDNLPQYNITAYGRAGGGGTAVHIKTNQDGSLAVIEQQGLIRSEGEGAVGVLFDNPVKAHLLSVSVNGENSVAVNAPDGVSLYYCKLEATGDGSKIVSGGDILLDTCAISGDAGHADIVNRKIVALAGDWLYWPLAQGQDIWESSLCRTFCFVSQLSFLLSGNEDHPAEVRRIPAQWDTDAIFNIETSVIGETVIPGELYGVYQGLGLEDDFSLDLTVEIRDGNKPCIISLKFGDDHKTGRRYVFFETYDDLGPLFKPEYGNFILWRSDGEDEDWYDFTDSPDISLIDSGIIYYYDEITSPVWFCIQEIDGEYSNMAVVYGYEGKSYGSTGGDRTGVDRGGESSVTAPTPKPEPESTPEPEPTPQPEPTPGSESTPGLEPSSRNKSSRSSSSSSNISSDTAVQTSAEQLPPPSADNPALAEDTPSATDASGSLAKLPNEWESDTITVISGRRLRMMMSAGDKVTFIKKELRLSFDTSALDALEIGDSHLFSVAVVHLERLEYTVSATLDGTELRGLPCVATLGGNRHDILVSGTYDFSRQSDEPDSIPVGAYLPLPAAAQPLQSPAGGEAAARIPIGEDDPPPWPAVIFALLGTGSTAGTAVFMKIRVKRHER